MDMDKTADPARKIKTLEDAVAWREEMRRAGKKISITNGCFDLLHRGHAEYLREAAKSGDALVVLINSDASVRELKGPTRPVNCEYDRAYLLACLAFVDAVVVFDGKRCHRELEALSPDAYAKGGDYTVETLDSDERAALFKAGAEIAFIPFVPGHSTTGMIEKAKGSTGKN